MNDDRKSSHASRPGAATPELMLERAVSFYEAVLGNMGEGVYTVDATGVVVSMNPAAERMLGWTLDELHGKKMHDVIHFKHRDGSAFPTEECPGIRVLNTGTSVFDQDDVFIRKDGTFFDVRYTSSPIIEMGKTTGLVVVFRDVTERKLIENKLRESEARFSKFMQHLPGLAWIKDGEGRYVFANSAAEAAFQTRMEELAGKTDDEVFPPERARAFIENDRLALESGSGRQAVELLEDEKGVLRYSLVSKFPIPVADGQPPMVGGMAIDITGQKLAEKNHEFLFTIAEKIRLSRNPKELLADIAASVGRYLDVHRCLFNEIDLENDTEIVHDDYFRTGTSVGGEHRISEYSPITSRSMVSGQTVVNRDSQHDTRTADLFEQVYGPNSELAYVAVPLLREGKWVASLWCSDDKPHNWTDAEIALLEGVAERTWSAVERMRAEEEKSKLASIVESSDDAIVSKDLNGIITSWNKGAERIFGYKAQEVVGRSITILIPSERVDEEPEILARIRRGESFDHYETVRRRKDGTLLDISLTVSPIYDASGKIVGASKVARDITAQKAAEETKAKLAAIVEFSDDAIISKDLDGIITSWNRGAQRVFGYRADEVVGQPVTMLMPPERVDEEPGILARVRRGESIDHYETVRRRKDGTLLDISLTVSPIRDATGKIIGASKVARDITARKTAAEALRASEEKFRTFSNTVPALIWFDDADGNCLFVNKAYVEFYGKSEEELAGLGWQLVLHPDDAENYISGFQAAQRERAPFYGRARAKRHDGQWRWLESFAKPLFSDDGTYLGHVGVSPDKTDSIEAEEALRESEEKARLSENQLRLVTDSIPALVSYVGSDERYKFVNRTYSDWFGLPKEKIVGKKLQTILGGRAYRALKGKFDEALSGKTVTFEANVNYKVAGDRFIAGAYVPDIDDDGRVKGFYALITDVSELKRSEELLRSSQDKMRVLTESFTDYAIFSTDIDGKIDNWNPGAANIFGYEEDEILGQSYEMLFTPEDVANSIPLKEMRTARKSGRASDERWQTRKDGTRFFAAGVMAPLYAGNTLSGYAKITSDLTDKQRYAESLQHSHDLLELRVVERTRELAEANAALVAEVNERRSAERQKIEFLQRLVTSQEDQRQRIARDLHDQLGQRLTALRLKIAAMKEVCDHDENLRARAIRLQEIAELLDSEVSFLAWELRPFALDELGLVDAIGTFVREWSKHYEIPAEFHTSGLTNVPLEESSDSHLYRIAQEALNNVVKHSRASEVNVLLEKTGGELVLIVEDNGIGMPKGGVSNGRKGGKGLGLEGMRERASLIGGSLEIESAPGAGTTIYARIPLKNET